MVDDTEMLVVRERDRMVAGGSLEDVLRELVHREQRGVIDVLKVLRRLGPIGLGSARSILEPWLVGRGQLVHVSLRDLEQLAELGRTPGVPYALASMALDALIWRQPLRRFEPHGSIGWKRDEPLAKVNSLGELRSAIRGLPPALTGRFVVLADSDDAMLVRYDNADSTAAPP